MLISVFNIGPNSRILAVRSLVCRTDAIVLWNLSFCRSISITSACLVTAQNGSNRGTSIRQTGSVFRSRAATLCQACKSAYAFGSVKIVTGVFSESGMSRSLSCAYWEFPVLTLRNRSSRSNTRNRSAVDAEVAPRYERCLVGGEEHDDSGNLFGAAGTLELDV